MERVDAIKDRGEHERFIARLHDGGRGRGIMVETG
jgi:hypothetical protein